MAGRIVGLLGENGSGKSTLMKVLFGMVKPDSGTILFKGQELCNHTPRDAITAGLGMIHQHFMLVYAMTVLETVMLGWKPTALRVHSTQYAPESRQTIAPYALDLEPAAAVGD